MILTDDEEQYVRWWDWLWFAIPIAGICFFVLAVRERSQREGKRERGES